LPIFNRKIKNMLFLEYKPSEHWILRKKERADSIDGIELPEDFYIPEDNKEEVDQKLISAIREAVNKRIVSFVHEEDIEREKYNITVIATVQLLRNKKTYSPILKATSGGNESLGNSYIAFTKDDMLITLLLLPESQITKEFLIRKMIHHAKVTRKENITQDDVSVHFRTDSLIRLSADYILKSKEEKPLGQITDPSQLPYKVRGDYRNSSRTQESYFTHKDYGKGKIIASEEGMASTGIWDSITVKFPGDPAPKVFKRLYTTTYFRTAAPVTVHECITALEILTAKKIELI